MAPYNESAKNATMKYLKEKRDKLTLTFPKGDVAKYKAYAASRGISLTKLIVTLIESEIKKDKWVYSPETTENNAE